MDFFVLFCFLDIQSWLLITLNLTQPALISLPNSLPISRTQTHVSTPVSILDQKSWLLFLCDCLVTLGNSFPFPCFLVGLCSSTLPSHFLLSLLASLLQSKILRLISHKVSLVQYMDNQQEKVSMFVGNRTFAKGSAWLYKVKETLLLGEGKPQEPIRKCLLKKGRGKGGNKEQNGIDRPSWKWAWLASRILRKQHSILQYLVQ